MMESNEKTQEKVESEIEDSGKALETKKNDREQREGVSGGVENNGRQQKTLEED